MDKPTLPYDLQQRFFYDCMKIYNACTGKQEQALSLKLFETNVEICLPAKSHIPQMLKVSCKNSIPDADFSIFIADSSCEGFEMPESPFDRYSFTRRGDICGSEESSLKMLFFHNSATICVVSKEKRSAVILTGEHPLLSEAAMNHILASCLSLLLEDKGILFLPVKGITGDNSYLLYTGSNNRLQDLSSEPPEKETPVSPDSWFAVKIRSGQSPLAQPFGTDSLNKSALTSRLVSDLLPGNDLCKASGKDRELSLIRNMNNLIFRTLSLLPFSGTRQMEMIENLFRQLTANRSSGFAIPPTGILLPSLSVIIPAFNAAKFLHETVQSIASLNYPNAEVIIVDDGSTDETPMLIPDLPMKCRYIYQSNKGASAARNQGLKASSGEVVLLLDADDLLNPPPFYSLLDHLVSNPSAVAVTGHAQKFKTGNEGKKVFIGSPAESFPWYIGAALFRKDAFEKNGLFDEELRFSEDTDWFIRAREKNLVVLRSPEISLFVRRHDENLTRDVSLNDLQILTMLKKKIARKS